MPLGPAVLSSRPLVREQIYEQLREEIIDGRLAPGEALRDKQIAVALGASRTPVREAIRRLEDEGLVQTASNRWTRVAPLDMAHALESYVVLEALETLALRLAWPALGHREAQELDAHNTAMVQAAHRRKPAAAIEADHAFHEVWIDRAGNGELIRQIQQIKVRLRRIELVYFDARGPVEDSYLEHRAIAKAVRAHSLSRAAKALALNWRGSSERIAVQAARAPIRASQVAPSAPRADTPRLHRSQ